MGNDTKRTLVATPSFLGAAAFFLVTPVGFAALTLGPGLVVVDAVVAVGDFFAGAALGLVVRLMAGAVSTVWKTRGLELPVADRVPSRGIFAFVLVESWSNSTSNVSARCRVTNEAQKCVGRRKVRMRHRMRPEERWVIESFAVGQLTRT